MRKLFGDFDTQIVFGIDQTHWGDTQATEVVDHYRAYRYWLLGDFDSVESGQPDEIAYATAWGFHLAFKGLALDRCGSQAPATCADDSVTASTFLTIVKHNAKFLLGL